MRLQTYIRPVGERINRSGHNGFRSHRAYRIGGLSCAGGRRT